MEFTAAFPLTLSFMDFMLMAFVVIVVVAFVWMLLASLARPKDVTFREYVEEHLPFVFFAGFFFSGSAFVLVTIPIDIIAYLINQF